MRFDPVAEWAAHTPTQEAIRQCAPVDGRWSYAELDALVTHASAWLRAHRVGVRDRIAVLASNRVECLVLAFAAWRVGATVVPLNWRLAPIELARLLEHAAPRLLLVDAMHETLAAAAIHATRATMMCVPFALMSAQWAAPDNDRDVRSADAPDDDPHDIAMLLYTSGSTGNPKAVQVTHAQLQANAAATREGWLLGSDDRALVATPLFHTAGWHAFTTPVLAAGGTVVLDGDFMASRVMTTMSDERITRVFMVPTQLLMLERDAQWRRALPAVRQWVIGGAPCPVGARDQAWRAGYPVIEAYGLTEFGPNCFTQTDSVSMSRPGVVGRPLPGVEARVVESDGVACPVDVVGALQLRGPQQCGGYFDDAEATSALTTPDGWVRTGDLASIDADGVVRIAGREKALFITGGEHVHPGEVERVLREWPEVEEAVVVAVPDPWWGEVGCAVIETRGPLEMEGLVRHLHQRLARYKVPHFCMTNVGWPLLGSGKIDRERVAELARAARLDEDSSMMAISQDARRG